MRSFQIQDQLDFMKKLLVGTDFDGFLLSEASITTFATFRIDGSLHPEFLDGGEDLSDAESSGYTLWRRVRPFFYELTRGKHTPLRFRIIFRLSASNTEKLLVQCGIRMDKEQIDGLFLNINFDGSALVCTGGTSLNTFTLDKTLEQAWDEMLEKFFRQRQISFE